MLQGMLSTGWQLGVAALGAAVMGFAWQQSLEGKQKLPVYEGAERYGVVNAADELNKTA